MLRQELSHCRVSEKDLDVIIQRTTLPTVSYRRWPNEGILVGQARRRSQFDDLNMTQFVMGFIKNVNYTLDSLTRQYMLAECYDLMKLADSTSWPVVKGAFISSMHSIEDGEIAWSNRTALLQRRMTQTHVLQSIITENSRQSS